jgi:hypothetical protein
MRDGEFSTLVCPATSVLWMREVWIAGDMERKEIGKNGVWQVEVWQAIGFDFSSYIRAIRWSCLSTLPSIFIMVHHQQLFYLPNNVPLSSSLQCLADANFLEQGSKIKLPYTSVKRNSA